MSQMQLNSQEGCFVQANQDEHFISQMPVNSYTSKDDYPLNIFYHIPAANQLKPKSRPTQITARVIKNQPILYSLPCSISQQCCQLQYAQSEVLSVTNQKQEIKNENEAICIQNQKQIEKTGHSIKVVGSVGMSKNKAKNSSNSKNKPSLNIGANKQNLSLSQYIVCKKLQLVYCKVVDSAIINGNSMTNSVSTHAKSEKESIKQDFTARIHNMSYLSDYNWKNYRILIQQQQRKQCHSSKLDNNNNALQPQSDLVFDSKFETGNLKLVYRNCQEQTPNYGCYFLLLEKDTNTHGYTNWFHYKVRNKRCGLMKFFILNIVKKTSFYKQGMKISIFSKKRYQKQQIKWFKAGQNIHFFQTRFHRFASSNQNFYSLYFEYDFEEQQDEVYFAANQPYSYTRMASLIKQLQSLNNTVANQTNNVKITIQTVGHTLANNIIPMIRLDSCLNDKQNKNCILVLGRQHPAQVAGSFISEYMIRYLLSDNKSAVRILQQFSFIFIPMVNPDGVIYGNSRCNLAGFDLNRQWGPNLLKQFTPQTYKIRNMITGLLQKQIQIKYVLDLHGHGKKLNSFLFCCSGQDKINNRIYPMILSKLDPRIDIFSCTYGINKDKQTTIRAQINDLGIKNTFTLENSYYGYYDKSTKTIKSYTQQDYNKLATCLIKALYIINGNRSTQQKQQILRQYGFNSSTIYSQLCLQIDQIQREQKKNLCNQDLLSDSDPDGDILKLNQRIESFRNNSKMASKIKDNYKNNRKSTSKYKRSVNKQKKDTKHKQLINIQQFDSEDQTQIAKLEGKLLSSKRTKTQIKFKQKQTTKYSRQKKDQSQQRTSQPKLKQKAAVSQFNTSSFYEEIRQKMNCSSFGQRQTKIKQIRSFNRARIFSKIKTQAIQVQQNLSKQMEDQAIKKLQIEKNFNTLKQESLKTMMNQSISMVGFGRYRKKLKWNIDKKSQNYTQNYTLQQGIKIISSKSIRDREQYMANRQKKSYSMMLSSDKHLMLSQSAELVPRQQKGVKVKSIKHKFNTSNKKYERFQNFIKDSSATRPQSINNSNVFYYFPVL